ncbi:MAG: hypothetical protein RI556_11285 [Hydrogenovibrio sp.]|uniref:hypothetical protein n=1 Tax=Hydrogenovibrio sp. TaxID=2065821 RepID=UPI0028701E1B|nr:hypothetical protein [Hydrogenovibrio sp.]MDR9499749.1 hypothetical protein [Hydrogenovibrio sp.]
MPAMTDSENILPMEQSVTVTLSLEKVVALMRAGYLCGADLHVSDPKTQALVHQACLQSCQQKMCDQCGHAESCPSSQVTWPLSEKIPVS